MNIKLFIILLVLSLSSCPAQELNTDSLFNSFLSVHGLAYESQRPRVGLTTESVKCGTAISNLVRFHIKSFTQDQQSMIKKITERPGLMEKSIVSPSGFFRIHYNLSYNSPSYDPLLDADQNAFDVALIADSVYDFQINKLGYPSPPSDNFSGGDELYDIYLIELGNTYGETQQEEFLSETSALSFIKIDNNFSTQHTQGLDAVRVTIAHELFHAVQIGGYKPFSSSGNEMYMYESFATAMEEFTYDGINDYYNYLNIREAGSYFRNPARHFTSFGEGYGLCIIPIFLKEKFGYDIIKSVWEYYRNQVPLDAMSSAISDFGSTLGNELNTLGKWTYFTGYRKQYADKNSGCFEEGEHYPLLSLIYPEYSDSDYPVQLSIPSLSNCYFSVLMNNGIYKDTITALITNGNPRGAKQNLCDYIQLSIFDSPSPGAKPIAGNYYYKSEAEQEDLFTVNYFLNGMPAAGSSFNITESDFAYPNPFYYSKHNRILFPVNFNEDKYADLHVYTPGMDLVLSKTLLIKYPHNKFVIEWDGLSDNREQLPSGIYLFTVSSNDKLLKGKIAIFRE